MCGRDRVSRVSVCVCVLAWVFGEKPSWGDYWRKRRKSERGTVAQKSDFTRQKTRIITRMMALPFSAAAHSLTHTQMQASRYTSYS